jgi:hypothetical protein
MKLTSQDLNAIQALIQPADERIAQIEATVHRRFNDMDQNFDALFKHNETTTQENIVIIHQLSGLEDRISVLEKKSS